MERSRKVESVVKLIVSSNPPVARMIGTVPYFRLWSAGPSGTKAQVKTDDLSQR